MRPIGDHALIGDCRSAALVARDGAIDWLCWPRFDSDAIFAGILDDRAGAWRIAPAGDDVRGSRRYLDGTNVLETRFEGAGGVAVLTDLMPVLDEKDKTRLHPQHEIIRAVRAESGSPRLSMRFEPRPAFGRARVRLKDRGGLGIRGTTWGAELFLVGEVPMRIEGDTVVADFTLRAGEQVVFSLSYCEEAPAVIPALGASVREAIDDTLRWWRGWSARIAYDGPHADAVVRSALALKLMSYAPSGAIIASPTTSLPEKIGGDLNWDYRFSWLRDASLTARAFVGLGFRDELESFVEWLVHSTRISHPPRTILYDVYGNRVPRERTIDDLGGHRGSRPVRVGNAARDQLQLDIYGEVVDAAASLARSGAEIDHETGGILRRLGDEVCRRWRDPDEGIWEPRDGRRHHTHSRLLCWVALDRLLEMDAAGFVRVDRERYARERDAIRADIEQHAWNERLQSYTGELGGDRLDAAVLLLSWYGFARADSPRMRATVAAIDRVLAEGDLVWRYRGESEEGAFGICSFWRVEHLALGGGDLAEARAGFDKLLSRANDVGLFAEEIDRDGAALGNFPQGFSHVGLINAALSLAGRIRTERRGEPPPTSERATTEAAAGVPA